MPPRALIFDLDGLLLDTESTDFAGWDFVFRELGVDLPVDRWKAAIGSDTSHFDPLGHLREQLGSIDEPDLQRRRRAHRDALLAELDANPGVRALLDAARVRGLALAVASSSERVWVERHLAHLGLRERFRALRCKEDVVRVKPDPALFRAAAGALGVAPADCVAFEDSPNGVAAAVAAGMPCVAVPGPMTRGLDFSRATLELDSLAGSDLDALFARLA
ncbi:MAG: HAD-IA family hydrolase [Myxococcota bacterium]